MCMCMYDYMYMYMHMYKYMCMYMYMPISDGFTRNFIYNGNIFFDLITLVFRIFREE
jgi:hypothetical protein